MNRIVNIIRDAHETDDSVRLDHDLRNRRRMVFATTSGRSILLDMPRTVHLRDGDGLVLDTGETIRVNAEAEPLIDITATSLPALIRIAWHLGNRHLPTQLLGDRLRIRHDHVIAEMVTGLGGLCEAIMAPFDPEGGAYADAAGEQIHAHDHGGDHVHGHHHHDDSDGHSHG